MNSDRETSAAGRIAVLGGGHASEHEVSLRSSANMARVLRAQGHGIVPVVIGTDGLWHVLPEMPAGGDSFSWPTRVDGALPGAAFSGNAPQAVGALEDGGVSVVVLGLHGRLGEDGTVQGFLEVCGLAHTGSGVAASALGADKVRLKYLLETAELPTPDFEELNRELWMTDQEDGCQETLEDCDDLQFPVVVKPCSLGSSVGVHIVEERDALGAAVASAFETDEVVLVEEYVRGREFTVAVLGSSPDPETFPVVEIVPRKATWFDAASKYEPGGADEIVPADLEPALEQTLRKMAARVHTLIGAEGSTRTDFILDEDDNPWILEINTLPGMTAGSLYPKAVAAAGWTLGELMERLVEDARGRSSRNPGS